MMMMMMVMMVMMMTTTTVFQVVYVKSISCHCLVHILSTSSSKSAPCTSVLNIFKWKSSYRYSPVHFLLTTFPDRPAKSRKQRPSFGDHGSHFTQKNTGFRALVFSSLNSHVPDLLHFPTTWLTWRLLDDDAVDMLMVRKLTITIVCNSEVSYLW